MGRCIGIALLTAVLAGCQQQRSGEKPVYRIGGVIRVDGVPQEGVQVILHDQAGIDTDQPTFPNGYTDAAGRPVISTYANGDGAPVGEYRVTFFWGQVNPLSMSYGGPDRLGGRYQDAAQSQVLLRVTGQGGNDLGVVDLTTR